jgi:hypothetical protein
MGAGPARTEEQSRDLTAATVEAADAPLRPLDALPLSHQVLPAQVLALQRAAGNGAVARAVRSGALRAGRVSIARLVKNPLDEAAGWKDAAGAAAAIDAYVKLPEADRRTAVATSYKKDLVRVLQALSAEDKVHKYRAAIMEIARWVQEEETRASAGMTDDQIATVQKDWMKKQAEDAAKAAAAAKAPMGKAPPPPTDAEVEAERKKAVESTSIPPAGPSGWDAMPAPDKASWTTRATTAIGKVVTLASAKHPELKVKASNFRIAFKDIENRGAGVLAFGEDDGAGGERAAIGFEFVTAVELNPAYVMDVVVHELYGHPEYGVYGTEYHLALYDKAMAKMPGYAKPAAGSREPGAPQRDRRLRVSGDRDVLRAAQHALPDRGDGQGRRQGPQPRHADHRRLARRADEGPVGTCAHRPGPPRLPHAAGDRSADHRPRAQGLRRRGGQDL